MTRNDVARAFVAGRTANVTRDGEKYSGVSIYSKGDAIFSYGPHFPLAFRVDGVVWVNERKYSKTTSCHQSAVRRALYEKGYRPTDHTQFGTGVENAFRKWILVG